MAGSWRLLLDGAAPGPFNMGVDEALLTSAIRDGTPSLRFYAWQGPWLSLGYAQGLEAEQARRLRAAGVGWVRRVTGGRAVLHGSDLTYSIVAREDELPSGVQASYAVVAEALLAALWSLGVSATRSPSGSSSPGSAVFDCFEEPASEEICLAGKKLSGSAQRRVSGAFLQHGSIRLAPDPERVVRAVVPDRPALGGTSLSEEGAPVSREALQGACCEALARLVGASFVRSSLSVTELRQARSRGSEPSTISVREEDEDEGFASLDSPVGPPQESPSSTR